MSAHEHRSTFVTKSELEALNAELLEALKGLLEADPDARPAEYGLAVNRARELLNIPMVGNSDATPGETQATARLIASAPELLTENKRLRHKMSLITKLIESGEIDSALDEAQIIAKVGRE